MSESVRRLIDKMGWFCPPWAVEAALKSTAEVADEEPTGRFFVSGNCTGCPFATKLKTASFLPPYNDCLVREKSGEPYTRICPTLHRRVVWCPLTRGELRVGPDHFLVFTTASYAAARPLDQASETNEGRQG